MGELIPFEFKSQQVRIILDEQNAPWWVAKDVCEVLEHSNHKVAVQGLDNDEKGVRKVDSPGGLQEMITISESGLYTLIMRSNKPQAKAFRKWVTGEVLPAIRRTGRYEGPQSKPASAGLEAGRMNRAIAAAYRDLARDPLLPDPYRTVCRARAVEYLTGESHGHMLPAVAVERRGYVTPTELSDILGQSTNAIGRKLKTLGLHGSQDTTGQWSEEFRDKSPYSAKEVVSYRYDREYVLPKLRTVFDQTTH